MKLYLYNLLIGLDQFCNVILGGAPDLTISTRCWMHRDNIVAQWAIMLIDFLFSWHEKNHCQASYESGDRQEKEVWGK